jgi:hypothetical protein
VHVFAPVKQAGGFVGLLHRCLQGRYWAFLVSSQLDVGGRCDYAAFDAGVEPRNSTETESLSLIKYIRGLVAMLPIHVAELFDHKKLLS